MTTWLSSLNVRRAVAAAATTGVPALGVLAVLHYGTPLGQTAAYAAYLVLAVLLPGTVVHKALRGTQETWLADLALGAATGLCLELLAWAAFSMLHLRGVLWLWPLLTLALPFRPKARARILERPTRSWHPAPTLLTAFAVCLVFAHVVRTYFRPYPLMPTSKPYYQDILWHLGLAWESQRAFPLGTPQVVGDGTLRYHWFADAHVGIGALISNTNVVTVMMRLWVLPVVALTVCLTAVLTERLSGRPWAAAVAAIAVVPTSTFQFWSGNTWTLDHFGPLSPSQIFAMPIMLLVLHATSDLLRSRPGGTSAPVSTSPPDPGITSRGVLVVAALGAIACMGAKASATPTLLGGLIITLVVSLFLRRKRRLLLGLTLTGIVVTAAALKFVAGGDAGSGYQLFSSYSILPFYRNLVTTHPNLATHLLGGLVNRPGVGPALLVGLTLMVTLAFLRVCAFVLPLFRPRLRGDLRAWLLAGTCLSACGPFLLVSHGGYSQYYFMYGVIPVGTSLLLWGLADAIDDDARVARLAATGGVVIGVISTALAWRAAYQPSPGSRHQWMATLHEFIAEFLIAATIVLVALILAWRQRRGGWRVAVPALVLVGLVVPIAVAAPFQEVAANIKRPLSAPAAAWAGARARTAAQATQGKPAPISPQSGVVVHAESNAAVWIQSNIPLEALTATNAQCITKQAISCDARRWWLSGLGGRRVLLSGWAYTPRGAHHAFYDPALYQLNQDTFSDPTAERVAQLRSKGVTWLVAEALPGLTVSPELDGFATRAYTNQFVTIYRLKS